MDDKVILKELREITKDRNVWKANISHVAGYLDDDYSVGVKAKALWILGEMGLRHPGEIEDYVDEIAEYFTDENPKLRERSANAIGRIGRADANLAIVYIDRLLEMRHDDDENVRHAFVWACENIATTSPEIFCEMLEVFYNMISDSSDKVRIEAPEMFRVIGKQRPECVKPYLENLEFISKNDENPTVRIHSAGAVRITKKALEKVKTII